MRKSVFALAAALPLASCGSEPGVYDVPLADAVARLQNADLDGFRMARQCGILIHIKASGPVDNAITWNVTSSGEPVLRFSVKLTPAGDGTRATIDVPADPSGGEVYDGKKFYTRPAVNQPLRPAIKELVDSALAQCPYRGQGLVNSDSVCNVQRAGLESGRVKFAIDDRPGMDSADSRRADEEDAAESARQSDFDPNFGNPTNDAQGSD